jgi:hypothetical protein
MGHTFVAIWLKMLALMRFVLLLMANIYCHVPSVLTCIVVSSKSVLFINLVSVKYAASYTLRIVLLNTGEYFPKANDDTLSIWEGESIAFDALENDYFAGDNASIVEFSKVRYAVNSFRNTSLAFFWNMKIK